MKSVDFKGMIERAYSILKPHEEYWLADNEYCCRYRYVKEAVEERPNYTKDTVEYIAIRAMFLVYAHNRIFKDCASVL